MPAVKIAPSVLSCDFSRLGEEVRAVVEAGADWVHFDVMDGAFVPNITMGPPIVAAVRPHCEVPMDVHLMIQRPEEYVKAFADAGADLISFHVEAALHPHRLIAQIKELGCKAGVVLNPGTSEDTLEFLAESVDYVLLMTVNPGFGGQRFIAEMLRKISNVREMLGDRDLEVDGGVDNHTVGDIVAAGANVLVAGSYIFGSASYFEAVESLKYADSPAD